MICNVCEEDRRCFSLSEDSPRPIPMPMSMKFRICVECLTKLIAPIATNKTVFEPSEAFPIPEHMQAMMERREAARKAAIDIVLKDKVKIP
jgi:hypothetical protein